MGSDKVSQDGGGYWKSEGGTYHTTRGEAIDAANARYAPKNDQSGVETLNEINNMLGGDLAERGRKAYEAKAKARAMEATLQEAAADEHFISGIELFNKNDYDGAMAVFNEAINEYSEHKLNGYILLGRCYYAKGDIGRAIIEYNKAFSGSENDQYNKYFQSRYCYYERARAYSQKKDYDKAINDCTEALGIWNNEHSTVEYLTNLTDHTKELWPDILDVYYLRGTLYIKKEKWKEAATDLTTAASQGHEGAKKTMVEHGAKIAEQIAAAKKKYEADMKAAESGDIDACYRIGECWHNGVGAPYNSQKEAFKWYLKAAKKGHAAACRQVGFIYDNGYAIAPNLDKAYKWYKKAAGLNDAQAKKWLKGEFASGMRIIYGQRKKGTIIGTILGVILGGGIGYLITSGAVIGIAGYTVCVAPIGALVGYLIGREWNKWLSFFIGVVLLGGLLYGGYLLSETEIYKTILETNTRSEKEFVQFTATVTVNTTGVIKAEPSADSATLKQLSRGDQVTVTGRTVNNWWYPVTHEGTAGYVHRTDVKRDK